MFDFVFTCYQSLISLNHKCIILSIAAKAKYEKGEPELCLKLYSVNGLIDLEIVDLMLIIMPYNS